MMQSPAHKHLFMTDLEWLALPPLLLRQFRIFRRRNIPIAFVSWGFLSEDAEKRLTDGARRLRPDDWKSGDRLWLIDVVAPFSGQAAIIKELHEKVFAGQKVKALQPSPDGKGVTVVEW
jgi:cytolysin-activating lysine-acyltransferase